MKAFSITLVTLLLITGCASQHKTISQKELSNRRDEVEVLQDELKLASRQWNKLQGDLKSKGNYPTNDEMRDLEYCRSILLETRDKLLAEIWRLRQKYGVYDDPF